MSPDQLDEALRDIRWTPDILACALGCDISLVHAWLGDDIEIPLNAGAWVGALAESHRAMERLKPMTLKGKRFRG